MSSAARIPAGGKMVLAEMPHELIVEILDDATANLESFQLDVEAYKPKDDDELRTKNLFLADIKRQLRVYAQWRKGNNTLENGNTEVSLYLNFSYEPFWLILDKEPTGDRIWEQVLRVALRGNQNPPAND